MPIPFVLRRMAVSIYDGDSQLTGEDRFLAACEIARSQLVKHKHLTDDSATGPLEDVRLTASGAKLDRAHRAKPPQKALRFNLLYRQRGAAPAPADPKDSA